MKDLMGLMKQAQAMRSKMADAQAELEKIEVEGQSGGGAVTIFEGREHDPEKLQTFRIG